MTTAFRTCLVLPGLLALLVGCGTDDATRTPTADEGAEPPIRGEQGALGEERVETPAPIETAEIIVRESEPPQYAVRVVSGLPSGCAEFERIDTERRAQAIELTVWNTVPADEEVVCTMIYSTTENTVELGSDFAPGENFTVSINGEETLDFTTQ